MDFAGARSPRIVVHALTHNSQADDHGYSLHWLLLCESDVFRRVIDARFAQ